MNRWLRNNRGEPLLGNEDGLRNIKVSEVNGVREMVVKKNNDEVGNFSTWEGVK